MPVDVLMPPGGVASFTAQGDRQLVYDTLNNPAAMQQQCDVLVLRSPRPQDINGTAIGRPSNLFHVDSGGGLKVMVGQNPTPQQLSDITARIQSSLLAKPGISDSPFPTVVSQTNATNAAELDVLVTAYTTSGDVITISSPSSGG